MIDGNDVKLKEELDVPPPDPVNSKEEMDEKKPIVLIVNQSSNVILNGIQYTGPIAFVGDCSGSMSSDDNIEKLRRTFSNL